MEMTRIEKFFVNNPITNLITKFFLMRKFLSFIDHEPKGKTLEIGCGIGVTTQSIAKKYPGVNIIAIDYDKEQIKSALKRQSSRIKFEEGDGSNLKFKDEEFDYVFQENAFHHIEDYKQAIRETYRVLKKNGYFFVMDFGKYVYSKWPIGFLFPDHSPFTRKSFEKDLMDAGFKIESSKGEGMFYIKARKK